MGRVSKRNIVVNQTPYIWTLKGNRIDTKDCHIKIHKEGNNKSILYVDPYDWNFEVRPEYIKKAIIFALKNKWEPDKSLKDVYISMEDANFILLPDGVKFKHEIKQKTTANNG